MTSLMCVKHLGGSVQVHDRNIVNDIIDSRDDPHQALYSAMLERSGSKTRPTRGASRRSSSLRSRSQSGVDSSNLINHTLKIQDWLNEKTVKDLQGKADVESRSVRKLYTPLLDTEKTFVKDVDEYINYKEMLNLRKKEMLHKNWNERVYEPLRKKIVEVMEGHDWMNADRRKREMHRQYLEFVNKKGHVFLDTIDSQIYYAQALNGHRPAPLLIETAQLRDPLSSQHRSRTEEERTILRCTTGIRYTDNDIKQVQLPHLPLVPLGRHGTTSKTWLEMPLRDIESCPRKTSQKSTIKKVKWKKMVSEKNASKLDYDAWSKIPANERTAEIEMALQKKKMFAEKPPYGIRPLTPAHVKEERSKSANQVMLAI